MLKHKPTARTKTWDASQQQLPELRARDAESENKLVLGLTCGSLNAQSQQHPLLDTIITKRRTRRLIQLSLLSLKTSLVSSKIPNADFPATITGSSAMKAQLLTLTWLNARTERMLALDPGLAPGFLCALQPPLLPPHPKLIDSNRSAYESILIISLRDLRFKL